MPLSVLGLFFNALEREDKQQDDPYLINIEHLINYFMNDLLLSMWYKYRNIFVRLSVFGA